MIIKHILFDDGRFIEDVLIDEELMNYAVEHGPCRSKAAWIASELEPFIEAALNLEKNDDN